MSVNEIHTAAAEGFEQAAEAYERSRPSYPDAVVARIIDHAGLARGRRVLDLAAGTGKLTRLLAPSGAEVLAVEPVAAMRATLATAAPGVSVLDGTAEEIPLPAASVDAVTVAQAFHWFDQPRALAEIARVLRPGGTLALLWNERDRDVDWVRAFGELLVDGDLERPYEWYYETDYPAVVAASGLFGAVSTSEVGWEQPADEDLVVERAASVSVVGALAPEARAAVLDRVRGLCRTHPDLAGRASFGFPYRAVLHLARSDGG